MSCTNPLKAFTIGFNRQTGKRKLKIASRNCTYLLRDGHSWIKCYDPVSDSLLDDENHIYSYDLIPCGSCLSCRLTKSRDWTVRCLLESQYHEQNWFVTVTYDDDHLPFNVDMLSGELTGKSTLCKVDFQKFIKRIRKNYSYDNHISYLCAGEYGDLSMRPHGHFLLFGLKLDDLEFYKNTSLGYPLYTSEFLNKCWPFGYVIVAPVTYESCAYVARYTMKKAGDNKDDIYDDFLIEKEFLLCSLKPAIGYQYYVDHASEIYKFDAIYLPDGKVVKPPRYFDRLYERDNPGDFERIKELRKHLAEISLDNTLAAVDYDYDTYLGIKDYMLKERTKTLLRKEM